MKRKISLFLIVAMLVLISAAPAQADVVNTHIYLSVGDNVAYVDGFSEELEAPPYIKNSSTLVPLRFIGEALGLTVNWNQKTKTVTLVNDTTIITLVIGKLTATVNGQNKTLAVAPEIKNGKTMVPVRFVSENMGASVKYYGDIKGISIATEPAFHFKLGETTNYSLLIPEGWDAQEDESENLLVSGEGAGFMYNEIIVDTVPTAADLKEIGQAAVIEVQGTVVADTEISEPDYYSVEADYKVTDSGGKTLDYTISVTVSYFEDLIFYRAYLTPKDSYETNPMLWEKLFVAENSM